MITSSFAGWLLQAETIDFGGLGRLTKEWHSGNPDGYDNRDLAFVDFLKRRYPEDWVAYQTYHRLINNRNKE